MQSQMYAYVSISLSSKAATVYYFTHQIFIEQQRSLSFSLSRHWIMNRASVVVYACIYVCCLCMCHVYVYMHHYGEFIMAPIYHWHMSDEMQLQLSFGFASDFSLQKKVSFASEKNDFLYPKYAIFLKIQEKCIFVASKIFSNHL